jgi:5-bromo-4-chloroindolyl phosphate hydrolysis protein
MTNFFKKNSEKVLTFLAILFLVVLVWFFVITIITSTENVSNVFISSSKNSEKVDFDLNGASKLNLRGLIQ